VDRALRPALTRGWGTLREELEEPADEDLNFGADAESA
jgi:hypothetical protein